LSDSLSIIVPVRDAEAAVCADLSRLLELLPDLTPRFEIIVVDDGSSDHTVELVRDLSRTFPQLRLIRHPSPRGREAAVKSGLQAATGRTIFIQEEPAALSASDLRRLWLLRDEKDLVLARAPQQPGTFSPELLERLAAWAQALQSVSYRRATSGIQMIRRDGAEQLLTQGSESGGAVVRPGVDGKATRSSQEKSASEAAAATARRSPTFLTHLRDLTEAVRAADVETI
jgi:hypothetical protein